MIVNHAPIILVIATPVLTKFVSLELCSGDYLQAKVRVVGPHNLELYNSENSEHDNYRNSEGSFRFRVPAEGQCTIYITNPAYSSPATVSLGWLVGRDDDDLYSTKYLEDLVESEDFTYLVGGRFLILYISFHCRLIRIYFVHLSRSPFIQTLVNVSML